VMLGAMGGATTTAHDAANRRRIARHSNRLPLRGEPGGDDGRSVNESCRLSSCVAVCMCMAVCGCVNLCAAVRVVERVRAIETGRIRSARQARGKRNGGENKRHKQGNTPV
jgi:hypothetical protein